MKTMRITVEKLKEILDTACQKGQITSDSPIVLSNDEEGNLYSYLTVGVDKKNIHHIPFNYIKTKEGKTAVVIYPEDSGFYGEEIFVCED